MSLSGSNIRKVIPQMVGNRGRTPSLQRMQSPGGAYNIGEFERWASIAGGGLVTMLGLRMPKPFGFLLLAAGGGLLYRGLTRYSAIYGALGINRVGAAGESGIVVEKAVTINKPVEELYRYWRNFENLPRFMYHLESVNVLSDRQSHWVAKGPFNKNVEWDAEIIEERENELISWQSLPGSEVGSEGSVRFKPAPADRGTEVHVRFKYHPPAGSLGAAVAKIFGEEPAQQVTDDLRRFKHLMEAGEIPINVPQPHGGAAGGTEEPK